MSFFKLLFFLQIIFYSLSTLSANIIKYCDIPTGNVGSHSTKSPEECLSLCQKSSICLSSTFISGWNKCFLKNNNKKFTNVRLYSGIIDRSNGISIIEEAYDIDYPVGDIKKIDNLKRHEDCKNACINEPECKAFTFIERYNSCWLKNRHNIKQTKIFYCLEK